MVISSRLRRSCSALLPLCLCLGTMHCDDGAVIMMSAPGSADPDAPSEMIEATVPEAPAGSAVGAGQGSRSDAPAGLESEPGASSDGRGQGSPGDPSSGSPSIDGPSRSPTAGSEPGDTDGVSPEPSGAPGHVPVDPATYTEELGLPVLHLDVDAAVNDEDYTPASISYRGHTFVGAEAKYRGQTSLRYPKKSFTLKFAKADRFSAPGGFSDERKLTLTTTFDDNSGLRARLAFELWNRIGADHVQVRTSSVVVYLNGEYWGLYTLTDHVDRHLMDAHQLSEDGNLYKARTFDANFRLTRAADGALKQSLSEGYTKEEGTPAAGEPGANADLEGLVSWVASSTDETFAAELDAHLVQRQYEDWWLLVSLIIAGDSMGKNSYHYRDPRTGADNRFQVVPWDFNDSFGQSWLTYREGREATRDPEELADFNLLFERLLRGVTRAPLIARYRAALQNEWRLDSILQSFDAWASEIELAALRDEQKWGQSYSSYFAPYRAGVTTHAEEVAFVRQWIVDRWTYVGRHYR